MYEENFLFISMSFIRPRTKSAEENLETILEQQTKYIYLVCQLAFVLELYYKQN